MIKSLHPTLKACRCGYINSKAGLYAHIDHELSLHKSSGALAATFWSSHGEVPLNEDDPRVTLEKSLEASLTREQKLALL